MTAALAPDTLHTPDPSAPAPVADTVATVPPPGATRAASGPLPLALSPTGLHALDAPEPGGDPLDPDDAAAWQVQATTMLAQLAPGGLRGRAVHLVVDDRLTLPGVMAGRLWPLARPALQATATAWFAQQGSAADWRVRAVLQPDGRHALVCAVREAVLQAVDDAVALAGGRLARAVPRWALALAAAEASAGRGPALVAAPRPGADHAVVALRTDGGWRHVELEPVDAEAGWATAADALQLRHEAAALAVTTRAPAPGPGPDRPPARWAAGPVHPGAAAPAGWSTVAARAVTERPRTAWSAAGLDLATTTAVRAPASWPARAALATAVALLAAVLLGTRADWQALDRARDAAAAPVRPMATAPGVARPPIGDEALARLRAELSKSWVPLLDRLAEGRPADIALQRIEPTRAPGAAGGPARLAIAGRATTSDAVLAWKKRLEADPALREVRLLGWQREDDGGRVRFQMEVVGGPDA